MSRAYSRISKSLFRPSTLVVWYLVAALVTLLPALIFWMARFMNEDNTTFSEWAAMAAADGQCNWWNVDCYGKGDGYTGDEAAANTNGQYWTQEQYNQYRYNQQQQQAAGADAANSSYNSNGAYQQTQTSYAQYNGQSSSANNYYNNQMHYPTEEMEDHTPWWWVFESLDDRQKDMIRMFTGTDDGVNGSMVFVYLWSNIVFIGIVMYGHSIIHPDRDYSGLIAALVLFANMCLVSIIYVGGLVGGIQLSGPTVEEHGFYGQFGVLMLMTSFLQMMFALVYSLVLAGHSRSQPVTIYQVDKLDDRVTDFRAMDEKNEQSDKNDKGITA